MPLISRYGPPAVVGAKSALVSANHRLGQSICGHAGLPGARWPKECGPDGRSRPYPAAGPFLIWQQPHPIYFAELLYRENPTAETLLRHSALVNDTAVFMASFAEFDSKLGRYFLGPPLSRAQESFKVATTWNPTYELEYWHWGLSTAQRWRERQKLARNAQWDHVIEHLSPLPAHDGVYIGAESEPNYWEVNRVDHPSLLAAFGLLPGAIADRETMRRTLHRTFDTWNWERVWGWDCAMAAMTATRLNEPDLAIRALLMDIPKNRFSPNGHSTSFHPCYLPANGSLLAELAMMAAGYEGCTDDAPGFPRDGKWKVQAEGLRPLL
jgi:hypothetical protein